MNLKIHPFGTEISKIQANRLFVTAINNIAITTSHQTSTECKLNRHLPPFPGAWPTPLTDSIGGFYNRLPDLHNPRFTESWRLYSRAQICLMTHPVGSFHKTGALVCSCFNTKRAQLNFNLPGFRCRYCLHYYPIPPTLTIR